MFKTLALHAHIIKKSRHPHAHTQLLESASIIDFASRRSSGSGGEVDEDRLPAA